MNPTPKKSKDKANPNLNISNTKMVVLRNLDGSISKTSMGKLQKEFYNSFKSKKRITKNIREFITPFKSALKDNGVGVYIKKKRFLYYDLYTSKGLKDYKRATMADGYTNVREDKISKRIKSLKKAETNLLKSIKKGKTQIAKPRTTRRNLLGKSGIKTELTFTMKNLDGDYVANIEANLKRVLKYNLAKFPTQKWNVFVSNQPAVFTDRYAFASKVSQMTADEAIEIIINRIKDALDEYGEDDDDRVSGLRYIGLSVYTYPNTIMGAGGHKTIPVANNIWFIYDTPAETNCFWRSIAFINIMKDINNGKETCPISILTDKDSKILSNKMNERSKANKALAKKKNNNIQSNITNEEDIKWWVNMRAGIGTESKSNNKKNTGVVIWNEIFKRIKFILPDGVSENECDEIYELQLYDGHFIPLIRWFNLINVKTECLAMKEAQIIKMKEQKEVLSPIKSKAKWEIKDYDLFFDWLRTGNWEVEKNNKITLTKKDIKIPPNYSHADWIKDEGAKSTLNKSTKAKIENKYLRSQIHKDVPNIKREINDIDNRIAAYDFEATPNGNAMNEFKVFRASMAYNEVDDENNIIKRATDTAATKTFGGEYSVRDWLNWVSDRIATFRDYTFYAHNGGKFDLLLILNEYVLEDDSVWSIPAESLIVLNGAYLQMRLVHRDSTPKQPLSITFKDSLKLLPAGLDKLTKEFNVPHKKIGEVVNHDEVNISNCYGGFVEGVNPKTFFASEKFKIEMTQKVYCNYDCIGLLEMLNDFNATIHKRCHFSITDCVTGATLSKLNYLNNYYDIRQPIYNVSDDMDKLCRAGYYGGRNESLYIGKALKPLYYFDFTSLYPHTARFRVPYGKPYNLSNDDIIRLNLKGNELGWARCFRSNFPMGMVKVRIKTLDAEALPLHGIKRDGKLLFPNFTEWTENTLWTSELIYGANLGIYDYHIIGAVCFQCEKKHYDNDRGQWGIKHSEREGLFSTPNGILQPFFEDAFSGKAKAKKEGKLALAFAEKIIANSGYGFWGINVNGKDGSGRDGLEIIHEDDDGLWNLMRREEVINVNRKGKYSMVRTQKKLEVKNFNVAIAAAICAEARMLLHQLLMDVQKEGGKVYYMDTDSCIIDIPLTDNLVKKYDWDKKLNCRSFGDELGTLKNECVEKLEKYFKDRGYNKAEIKKLVQIEIDANDGELYFDEGIFGGCKQYCLKKNLVYVEKGYYKLGKDLIPTNKWIEPKNGSVIASAFKGCKKKLDYSDYEHLLFGTKIKEQRKIEAEILSRNHNFKAPKGFRLYERQIQFRSSLITHIAENESKEYTPIQRLMVDKSFRINYLKGTIDRVDGSRALLDGRDGSGFVKTIEVSGDEEEVDEYEFAELAGLTEDELSAL